VGIWGNLAQRVPPTGSALIIALDPMAKPGYTRVHEVCHAHSNRRSTGLYASARLVW
jgi:hypothetical protein